MFIFTVWCLFLSLVKNTCQLQAFLRITHLQYATQALGASSNLISMSRDGQLDNDPPLNETANNSNTPTACKTHSPASIIIIIIIKTEIRLITAH